MPLDEWTFAGGITASAEGFAKFKNDPISYNLDYGRTYTFQIDPSDYNIDFGLL